MKKLNFVLVVLTAIFTVACQKNDLLPEKQNNPGKAVDLGLSVLWADMNVGASNEYDAGAFFSWGETYSKKIYTLPYYSHCTFNSNSGGNIYWNKYFFGYTGTAANYPYNGKLINDNGYGDTDDKKVMDSSDDAATVNWGNGWRTPTPAEWQELIDGCEWTYHSNLVGNSYYTVAGNNGNTIKIVICDFAHLSTEFTGAVGWYWTNSLSEKYSALGIDVLVTSSQVIVRNKNNATYAGTRRDYGLCVRPVKNK